MAKSKKTQHKKSGEKSKGDRLNSQKGSTVGSSKKNQAKPNLQPARIIKKPEPAISPASSLTTAVPKAEELAVTENSIIAAPEPEPAELKALEESQEGQSRTIETPKEPETKPEIVSAAPIESTPTISSHTQDRVSKVILPPSVKRIKRRKLLKKTVLISLFLVVLGGAGALVYGWKTPDPQLANQKIIADVKKLALVPDEETPAISTVVDETQVTQEFLRGTKKGDKVLLYFQAERAIVYRPSSGQIINMGPIETPKPRVFLRNGSTAERVTSVSEKLQANTDFIVESQDESPKKNYDKTIVVDVTGVRPDIAARLAKTLGVSVGELPEGESKPDADLLVLIGSDQTSP